LFRIVPRVVLACFCRYEQQNPADWDYIIKDSGAVFVFGANQRVHSLLEKETSVLNGGSTGSVRKLALYDHPGGGGGGADSFQSWVGRGKELTDAALQAAAASAGATAGAAESEDGGGAYLFDRQRPLHVLWDGGRG
jgi:hypothetical protein